MSDSDTERIPILPQTPGTPTQPTAPPTSHSPILHPPESKPAQVSAPPFEDSDLHGGLRGYMSRETFKFVFSLLSIVYGVLNVGVWISLGLTVYYLEGTSGYFGAVLGLASQMIIPVVQCSSIASRVNAVGYKHPARMGLKTLVNLHLVFLTFQLLSSLTCVGISVVYGIRYGDNDEENVVNSDTNEAVGILNVSLATVVAIVTVATLYVASKLRRSLIMASVNSGPFASDVSYSQC